MTSEKHGSRSCSSDDVSVKVPSKTNNKKNESESEADIAVKNTEDVTSILSESDASLQPFGRCRQLRSVESSRDSSPVIQSGPRIATNAAIAEEPSAEMSDHSACPAPDNDPPTSTVNDNASGVTSAPPSSRNSDVTKLSSASRDVSEAEGEETSKRGRGRPKKTEKKDEKEKRGKMKEEADSDDPKKGAVVKKGRGRPKKSDVTKVKSETNSRCSSRTNSVDGEERRVMPRRQAAVTSRGKSDDRKSSKKKEKEEVLGSDEEFNQKLEKWKDLNLNIKVS